MFENNLDNTLLEFNYEFGKYNKGFKSQNVKFVIPNYGIIPERHQGAGNKAWTFIDEIIIK